MQKFKALFSQKKSELQIWFDNLHFSSVDFIRYISFFGVGFVFGLLFRRWSKYIIVALLSISLILTILHGFSIISINFVTIQKMTGIGNITNLQNMLAASIDLVQKYIYELGCSGIGFIIGFKTG
ncbi:MAG: FUN14 domain-containing protein [Candidatus Chromulinivorax sp.]